MSEVLSECMQGYELTRKETSDEKCKRENGELLQAFLAAKKIEGCGNSIEKENWQRLAVLAGKGMIDVIVVSGLSRLSYCPEEILQTMELLQAFQVQIDCIGYGILDYARLKQYLMHTWEKQEQFEQDLDAYLCSCCTREGI